MTVSCRRSPCDTRSPASLAAAMDRAAMLAPCRRHLSVTSVQLNKRALEHDGGRCDIDCWACSRHVTTQNDVVVWLSIISFIEQVNKYFVLHRVCRDVVYRCRCGVVSVCVCVSVCLSVYWTHSRDLQNRLNQSRCRFRCGFTWAQDTCAWWLSFLRYSMILTYLLDRDSDIGLLEAHTWRCPSICLLMFDRLNNIGSIWKLSGPDRQSVSWHNN